MGVLQTRGDDDDEHADITISGLDDLDGGTTDDLLYELDEWSDHDRTVLRDRLETLMLPHRWEEATLVVSPNDEAWVERVMDQVEEDLADGGDADDEQIAYDLSGWDDDACLRLLEVLAAESIPYGLDGDELVVEAVDERRVDQLVAVAVDPSMAPAEGPAATMDLMSQLFIASQRLVHDAGDREGVAGLVQGAEMATATGPPFGMDAGWWRTVATRASELAALLASEPSEPEQVAERATELRDALRPYI